jgi:hypothetical protein
MSEFKVSSAKKLLLGITIAVEILIKCIAYILEGVVPAPWGTLFTVLNIALLFPIILLFLDIWISSMEHRSKIKEDVEKITGIVENSKRTTDELLQGFRAHDGTLVDLREYMEARTPEKHLGLLKEVTEPTVWEFTRHIVGWNPNWSIELSEMHPLYEAIRKTQTERIKNSEIGCIEYIFLEDYEVETGNLGMFGSNYFLKFLEDINKEERISEHVNKYRLWIVPKEQWDRTDTNLGKFIARFRNFIFIAGKRDGRNYIVLFVNKPGFYGNDFHKYYVEIFDKNEVYAELLSHFQQIKKLLELQGIRGCGVKYNEKNGKFEFTQSVATVPEATPILISGENQPILTSSENQLIEPIAGKKEPMPIKVKK